MGLMLPDSRLVKMSHILGKSIALSKAYPVIIFDSPHLKCKCLLSIKEKTDYLLLRWPLLDYDSSKDVTSNVNKKFDNHVMCKYPEELLEILGFTLDEIQEHFPDYQINLVELPYINEPILLDKSYNTINTDINSNSNPHNIPQDDIPF